MNDHRQNVPKLLEGERVEVKQRDKGLRGSWHPATVVGLKPGRRIVEYEELLTKDGLQKLTECVSLADTMRGTASRSPRKNDTLKASPCSSVQVRKQSRLRPVPPPCTKSLADTCIKGLFVDVFFQDAWWEAVLLDDTVSVDDDPVVNVVFPDEGDHGKVYAKSIRISQQWEEDTGQWSMKGKCNLPELYKRRILRKKGVSSVIDPQCDREKLGEVGKEMDKQLSSINTVSVDRVSGFEGASADEGRKGGSCNFMAREDPLHSSCDLDDQSASHGGDAVGAADAKRLACKLSTLIEEGKLHSDCEDDNKQEHLLITYPAVTPGSSADQVVEEALCCSDPASDKYQGVILKNDAKAEMSKGFCSSFEEQAGENRNRGVSAHKKKQLAKVEGTANSNTVILALKRTEKLEKLKKASAKPETKVKGQQGTQSSETSSGDDESDCKTDGLLRSGTLSSFKERLVRKRRMQALERKAAKDSAVEDGNKKSSGRPGELEEACASRVSHRARESEEAVASSTKEETLKAAVLKNLVREIAKEALLEAGFRIELRPRRNKDYEDAVYVSPEGRTYWSVPNAWRAYKLSHEMLQPDAKKTRGPRNLQGSSLGKQKGAESLMDREILGQQPHWNAKVVDKKQPHWNVKVVDKKQRLFSSGKKVKSTSVDQSTLLAAALKKVGGQTSKDSNFLQNTGKTELTNSQLVDLLLEDMKVLRRVTTLGSRAGKKKKKFSEASTSKKSGKMNVVGPKVSIRSSSSSHIVAKALGRKRKIDMPVKRLEKRVLRNRNGEQKPKAAIGRTKHSKRGGARKEEQGACMDNAANQKDRNLELIDKATPKRKKSGKRHMREGHEVLEEESAPKKMKANSREKLSIHGITSKKEGHSWQDTSFLCYSKGKKGKVNLDEVVSHSEKRKSRKARSGFRLEVRAGTSRKNDETDESLGITKQTIFSWMMDRGVMSEREKWCYIDRRNNEVLKEGLVTREGIMCKCCKKYYTTHTVKVHAGSNMKDPEKRIIFASGKSLLDCQLQAWGVEMELRKRDNYVGVSFNDRNDDTCILCGDGGDLLCCDHCPSTFHTSCLHLEDVPDGNWYCPKCRCSICGASQYCKEGELIFANDMLLCIQCEHRYHRSCLHGNVVIDQDGSFCGDHCKTIHSNLAKLVGITNVLDDGISWTLLRCKEESWESCDDLDFVADYHSKLAVALLVMEECFVPMDDPRTNIDMIAHTLYNRRSEFDRLNYRGFYTIVLEREGEVISVASIRVHGARLAEMPLIGTREQYRRQGMCRLLVGEIEKILSSLGVTTFVLPAIPELLDTWTHAFGFMPLDASQRLEYRDVSMMMFPGTEVLHKPLVDVSKSSSSKGQICELLTPTAPIPSSRSVDDHGSNICLPEDDKASEVKGIPVFSEGGCSSKALNNAFSEDGEDVISMGGFCTRNIGQLQDDEFQSIKVNDRVLLSEVGKELPESLEGKSLVFAVDELCVVAPPSEVCKQGRDTSSPGKDVGVCQEGIYNELNSCGMEIETVKSALPLEVAEMILEEAKETPMVQDDVSGIAAKSFFASEGEQDCTEMTSEEERPVVQKFHGISNGLVPQERNKTSMSVPSLEGDHNSAEIISEEVKEVPMVKESSDTTMIGLRTETAQKRNKKELDEVPMVQGSSYSDMSGLRNEMAQQGRKECLNTMRENVNLPFKFEDSSPHGTSTAGADAVFPPEGPQGCPALLIIEEVKDVSMQEPSPCDKSSIAQVVQPKEVKQDSQVAVVKGAKVASSSQMPLGDLSTLDSFPSDKKANVVI